MKSGRTIAGKRERLEKAAERTEAHKKIKKRQISRVIITLLAFFLIAAGLVYLGTFFVNNPDVNPTVATTVATFTPTIEIVDQDASATGHQISTRMKEYIGMLEVDLKELGLTPTKAVIPTGSIREVDFYLDGYTGYLKTIIDRDAGVTAEDADRMLRSLASIEVTDFQYIDLRVDGKAYWK
jgi:hypothetical protein